jgi:preprotein translocase subunit SecD
MKPIKDLLNETDPIRLEPAISSSRRDAARQTIVAAAAAASPLPAKRKFSALRLAAVSLAVAALVLFGSFLSLRTSFETHAAVRFEVRLAEDAPAAGLREVRVPDSGRAIYLHPDVVVGNADIARAEIVQGNEASVFLVSVTFTPEGARKMSAATQNHIGKPVAILIDDELVMAPTLRSAIGGQAEINGNYSREQAERIVKGI